MEEKLIVRYRLAKLFNSANNSVQQKTLEEWMKEKYPEIFATFEAAGISQFGSMRSIPIDIPMEP